MLFEDKVKMFDTRHLDNEVKKFVDLNFEKEFMGETNKNRVAILATTFYDSGGHTECVRRLVSNLSSDYEFKVFLSRKLESYSLAPNKTKLIQEHATIDGFHSPHLEFKTAVNLIFNLIKEYAPKVIFVYMNMDDYHSAAILALIKKYTNIKIIYCNHGSHYPAIGFSFADLVLVAMQSTHYIDKNYRKCDKHCIVEMLSDKVEDIKYFSDKEIAEKKEELGISSNDYCTMSGGDSYKFFENGESPYFEMIKSLLLKESKLKHIVLLSITRLTQGEKAIINNLFSDPHLRERLILLPLTNDYEILFQCCDVFIDSFPVSSALTQIDLMKFKKPTVIKINSENVLLSFHEYMPKNYPYMFDNIDDMTKGILKLLYSKEEQQKVIEMNYQHYLETFEGNVVKQKYIDLIENSNNLCQFHSKLDESLNYNPKISYEERRKKMNLKNEKIEELIKNTKIVHIMHGEKFDRDFANMVNRNFNPKEHLFMYSSDSVVNKPEWLPVGDNAIEVNNLEEINLNFPNVEKIICHSLIRSDLIDKLYKEPELLKKSYWQIWGLDLYEAKRDKKNDFVRKNMKGYINKTDEEYARKKYGMEGKFFDALYNFPISKEMLDMTTPKKNEFIRIQINNSCDMTTFEMLDILSKFKNENIKITTIVSYEPYGNLSYREELVKKGIEIFQDKFEYIYKWLNPEEYAQHLAENDIFIFYQNKQQGVGNALASVYLGKKVFIRNDVSVNKYLNEDGIKIFDSNDIKNMSFAEFIEFKDKEKDNNDKNVQKYFDEKYLVSLWDKVFNDDSDSSITDKKGGQICHKR